MANERARTLRKNQTDAERRFWAAVRRRQLDGHRFRRQHPLGRYVVDFVCLERKLIIEIDGGQHSYDVHHAHDADRDAWLESLGYKVMRYWNGDIFNNLEGVLTEIAELLRSPIVESPD